MGILPGHDPPCGEAGSEPHPGKGVCAGGAANSASSLCLFKELACGSVDIPLFICSFLLSFTQSLTISQAWLGCGLVLLRCLQSGEEQGLVFSFNFISLERCFLTTPPMYCSPPSPLLHCHHALLYHAISLWNTWGNMKGSCFSVHFLSHLPATMSAPQSRRPPSPIFPSALLSHHLPQDASYVSTEGGKPEALADVTLTLEPTHVSGEPVGCAITKECHPLIVAQCLLRVCCWPGTVMVLSIHLRAKFPGILFCAVYLLVQSETSIWEQTGNSS